MKVLKSIGHHTIQDKGRVGFQAFGISVGGVMDEFAFDVANILCLNPENAPAIELTSGSLELGFRRNGVVAVTGFAHVSINNQAVGSWKAIHVQKGDCVQIQVSAQGNFAYLAVAGGWKGKVWLQSYSTWSQIGVGSVLKSGDKYKRLFQINSWLHEKRQLDWSVSPSSLIDYGANEIRLIPGNEINNFTTSSVTHFIERDFQLSPQRNRMAYLIHSSGLEVQGMSEMESVAVQKGTIQHTPNGTLYILMSDSQTIGGYPRVGQVAAVDLPVLSQKTSQEKFRFKWVSVSEAIDLIKVRKRQLENLRHTVTRKFTE